MTIERSNRLATAEKSSSVSNWNEKKFEQFFIIKLQEYFLFLLCIHLTCGLDLSDSNVITVYGVIISFIYLHSIGLYYWLTVSEWHRF